MKTLFLESKGPQKMTILFDIWIDGVLGNARIISDKEVLHKVWVEGDRRITSMIDFNESYIQLFDDMAVMDFIDEYTVSDVLDKEQNTAIRTYIETFERFDETLFVVKTPITFRIPYLGEIKLFGKQVLDHKKLLGSNEWNAVEKSARRLVTLFEEYITIVSEMEEMLNWMNLFLEGGVTGDEAIKHINSFVTKNVRRFVSGNYVYEIKKERIQKVLALHQTVMTYGSDPQTSEEQLKLTIAQFLSAFWSDIGPYNSPLVTGLLERNLSEEQKKKR